MPVSGVSNMQFDRFFRVCFCACVWYALVTGVLILGAGMMPDDHLEVFFNLNVSSLVILGGLLSFHAIVKFAEFIVDTIDKIRNEQRQRLTLLS